MHVLSEVEKLRTRSVPICCQDAVTACDRILAALSCKLCRLEVQLPYAGVVAVTDSVGPVLRQLGWVWAR